MKTQQRPQASGVLVLPQNLKCRTPPYGGEQGEKREKATLPSKGHQAPFPYVLRRSRSHRQGR